MVSPLHRYAPNLRRLNYWALPSSMNLACLVALQHLRSRLDLIYSMPPPRSQVLQVL
jgi:hypothetical protein